MKAVYPVIIAVHSLTVSDHDIPSSLTFGGVPVFASHQYLQKQCQCSTISLDKPNMALRHPPPVFLVTLFFTGKCSSCQIKSSLTWLSLHFSSSSDPMVQWLPCYGSSTGQATAAHSPHLQGHAAPKHFITTKFEVNRKQLLQWEEKGLNAWKVIFFLPVVWSNVQTRGLKSSKHIISNQNPCWL